MISRSLAYSIWVAGFIGGLAVMAGRLADANVLYIIGQTILAFVVSISVTLLIARPWNQSGVKHDSR